MDEKENFLEVLAGYNWMSSRFRGRLLGKLQKPSGFIKVWNCV
jgi:hypothetical protein